LLVKVLPSRAISSEDAKTICSSVSSMFRSIDLDLAAFYEYVKKDKVLAPFTRRLRGLRSPTTPTVFEALVSSIIEQQISLNVALVLENKLIRAFGDKLKIGKRDYYAFPTPQRLGLQLRVNFTSAV
jgi:DNA-3-methyladenine glycosylase II